MKALPLLLAASLVANAAWFTTTLLRPSGSPDSTAIATRDDIGRASRSGEPAASRGSAARAIGSDDRSLAAAFKSDDPEQLRDALRALGVDDALVRQIVGARLWKNYETRLKAIGKQPDDNAAEWWKNPGHFNPRGQTREQREEMRRIQREFQAENERLLGPPDLHENPWLERQYGFLPAEKRRLLQQTEQDYNELIGEINNETSGFMLPSDREQLRFLQEEKRRDLESLLSPEELRAYDLRNSPTAQQLRWKMTKMNATEAEYLQIFDLQQNFDALYSHNTPFAEPVERDQAYWKARQEAEKELNAQIRATIGEDRYLDYVMSNDHGFQQVQAATQRLGLPEDTPRKLYALRNETPAAANRIADDATLSYDEKRAALTRLAETTRAEVRARLGSEAADVILKNHSFRWIADLEKGNITTFDENGGQGGRSLPKPSPAKKP